MDTDVVYDDEFAKRKPIDNVWLAKEYPVRSWPLETVLQWHREMMQPKMLNSMDSFVWARLKLDMTTPKKVFFSILFYSIAKQKRVCSVILDEIY